MSNPTSNQQIDPSVLWQWLIDLANQAGPFDSRMLMAAAEIVGAAKLVGVCRWTRLPDVANPLETHRVQYKAECNEEIARGVHAIYPDNCPHCHGRVKIVGADETPAPQPEAHWETPCPKREDKLHCECWYGGDACCACGDSASLDGTAHPPCSGQKTSGDPA